MNKPLYLAKIIGTAVALTACASAAQATVQAKVVSATPVVAQVAVPHEVCSNVQQVVPQRASGMGALLGAVVGAAAGHGVGAGGGKAAATGIGMIAGAVVGDRIESNSNPPQVQTVRQCQEQTSYENRVVAYNVVYEYGGQQYQTQMAQKPGRTISVEVEVTPSDATLPPQQSEPPVQYRPMTQAPVEVAPTVVYAPAPIVVQRAVYAPPVVIGYQGYYGYGGHRHHRHWD